MELLGGAAELQERDRRWNDVLDETRSHCPNLRAAYAFGAEAVDWFPTQLVSRPEIINTANCCHPMHILIGALPKHLLQYSQTVKLMASECESGSLGEDADIRWHLDESTDADDTVLSSLEGAKMSEAQERGEKIAASEAKMSRKPNEMPQRKQASEAQTRHRPNEMPQRKQASEAQTRHRPNEMPERKPHRN